MHGDFMSTQSQDKEQFGVAELYAVLGYDFDPSRVDMDKSESIVNIATAVLKDAGHDDPVEGFQSNPEFSTTVQEAIAFTGHANPSIAAESYQGFLNHGVAIASLARDPQLAEMAILTGMTPLIRGEPTLIRHDVEHMPAQLEALDAIKTFVAHEIGEEADPIQLLKDNPDLLKAAQEMVGAARNESTYANSIVAFHQEVKNVASSLEETSINVEQDTRYAHLPQGDNGMANVAFDATQPSIDVAGISLAGDEVPAGVISSGFSDAVMASDAVARLGNSPAVEIKPEEPSLDQGMQVAMNTTAPAFGSNFA